ncbi:hypothetical protein POVWA2_022390 [Plasmodium ovale wallikeri]|uniref:Uncharacterized protein n=1 Tax=Plasmodium ovale wallikeri TaxID=864142 RepID=A0A1A8YU05_PLAOA|nr:hypothetical protein POVWA1_022580 [Plasmodium ovale wallikeri]SBT34914.1 hypothetical protein POVWA2_022390 [Plasmodium ovale wallikeri]
MILHVAGLYMILHVAGLYMILHVAGLKELSINAGVAKLRPSLFLKGGKCKNDALEKPALAICTLLKGRHTSHRYYTNGENGEKAKSPYVSMAKGENSQSQAEHKVYLKLALNYIISKIRKMSETSKS